MMLPAIVKLLMALFADSRVPRYLKILTAGAVAYVALPLDFLPDFVPTAGRLDDLLVILLLLEKYMKSCPPEVFNEHWDNILGEDFDFEESARKSLEELDPLVGERFATVRDWIVNSASRISRHPVPEPAAQGSITPGDA